MIVSQLEGTADNVNGAVVSRVCVQVMGGGSLRDQVLNLFVVVLN